MIALHAKRSPVSIAIQPHPCRLGKSKKLDRKVAAVQYDNNQLRNCHVLTEKNCTDKFVHVRLLATKSPCITVNFVHPIPDMWKNMLETYI